MQSRAILVGMLLLAAAEPACAEPAGDSANAVPFERRLVGILNAGGTAGTIESRLSRVEAELVLTVDQRAAIDALRAMVRGRTRPRGVTMAEAEAFAGRYPGTPAAAMLIAEAALANDEPKRAADVLIAAADRAGSLMQLLSPATVSKLSDELDALKDRERIASLARVLLDSGWSRGSAGLRSYLAMAAIRAEIAAGRVDRARRLLPAVSSPATLHLVLIDNRLAPLRQEVETLAGPRLQRAWRDWLTRTRDEWLERGDMLSATAYAEALKQANQYEAVGAAFLGRFLRGYNCPTDMVARAVADTLAESLARSGRWTKAEDVMRRSGGISPPVYAAMLLERGDFGRASALFSRSLRAAEKPGTKVEERALAWLQAASACAAYRDGRRDGASAYDPRLLDVSARLFVLLCMDRDKAAKSALLAALADEDERAEALRWVQPFADPPVQSQFRKAMNRRIRSLQADPAVVAAVARHGAILDWPLTAAAPLPADLPAGRAPVPWQCGEQGDWALPQAPESLRLPDSQP